MSDQPHKPLSSVDIGDQRNSGYIWLAYSAFFFIDPILSHSARLWIESGIIYAVFLVAYIAYMKSRSIRQRHALLVVFYALGVVSFPINAGASSFFIYSGAFLPFVVESVPVLISVLAVQTLDVAERTHAGFRLIGRLPRTEPRGCSLSAEDLAAVNQGQAGG